MSSNEDRFKKFQNLSVELKQAILSEATSNFIKNLAKENGVGDKSGILYELTTDVLRGDLAPESLAEGIEKALNLEKEKSLALAKEIEEKIFYPIKEALEKMYGEAKLERPRLESFEYVAPPKAGEAEMAQLEQEMRELRQRKPLVTPSPEAPIPPAQTPLTEQEAREEKKQAYGEPLSGLDSLTSLSKQAPESEGAQEKPAQQKPAENKKDSKQILRQAQDRKPRDKYREEPTEEELKVFEKKFGRPSMDPRGKPTPKVPPVDTHVVDLKNIDETK
jgi:hypothetical protein